MKSDFQKAILKGTWAFDFDGVLAVKPMISGKKWGFMRKTERIQYQDQMISHYSKAAPLLQPPRSFYVITARKNQPEVCAISNRWLQSRYGKKLLGAGYLSTGRTIENVVNHKVQFLRHWKITDFVEDNTKVLKGIQKTHPAVRLWYFDSTMAEPTPFK